VPSDALLHRVAASTEGFAGADLQALCTAAVMAAVARAAPSLVDQLCDTSEDQEQCHPNEQHQQQQHLFSQQQQQHNIADHSQLQHEQLHQQVQHEQPGQEQQAAQARQSQPGQHTNGQQLPNQVDEQSEMQKQPENQHPQLGPMLKNGQQQLPQSLSRSAPWKLLEKLTVKAVDWQAALAAAPLPCSARQNISALSSGHARAMPHHMVPMLLPSLTMALRCITSAQLPWQGPIASALEAAGEADDACGRQEQVEVQDWRQKSGLEAVLTELGAIQAPPLHQSGVRLYHNECLFYLLLSVLLQRCKDQCSVARYTPLYT